MITVAKNTSMKWKYIRTQYHRDIARKNYDQFVLGKTQEELAFSGKWWENLDEELKIEWKKKKSDSIKKYWSLLDEEEKEKIMTKIKKSSHKGKDSILWKWWIKWICSICGWETARKKSKKCSDCYHKSQLKNPLKNWKYTHAKWKCLECSKELSDTYRSLCRVCSHKGERSHHWKWGITPENVLIRHSIENKLWKDAILSRDNFTCQKTGKRWGNIEVHHILNFSEYPELRFAIDNGITLSGKSHREFHKMYWYKNNTKEQLNNFLIN